MPKPIIGIGADVLVKEGKRDRTYMYATYVDAVRDAGAVPVLVPPQPENLEVLAASLDGILLAGGRDCDPRLYGEAPHDTVEQMDHRRQDADIALARLGRDRRIPTLGVCLGSQVMTVAAGGSLVQDIGSQIENALTHDSDPADRLRHKVTIEEGTRLAAIVGSGVRDVNSSHHQSVKTPGSGMRITALAPDGVVEAVEDPAHPFYIGVQWHPEDMGGEESSAALFSAFIAAAQAHAEHRRRELPLRDLAVAGAE
jgi:putative glutamine amidotransferase